MGNTIYKALQLVGKRAEYPAALMGNTMGAVFAVNEPAFPASLTVQV